MWLRFGVPVAVAAVAIFFEYVEDIRTPRAELVVAGVIGINQQIPTERYNAIAAAMKAKYGKQAETWIGPDGTTTKVNGRVVATERIAGRFRDAIGVTLVGSVSAAPFGIFPFRIGPGAVPDPQSVNLLATTIEERFRSIIRAGALTDQDFAIGDCRNFTASELGLKVARWLLHLGKTTMCVVSWKGPRPSRMLVGITMADGFWVWQFARGACRILAYAWLRKLGGPEEQRQLDFLQCMLVDRPDDKLNAVSTAVYQVRPDGTLALAIGGSKVVPP